MIVFSKEEIREIQSINFHDAKVSKIISDYDEGIVEMPIIMDDSHQYAALVKFENITYVEINLKEPWGPGCYISALSVDDHEGDYFKVSILLNSGDEVNIIASRMIYSST